MNIETKSEGSIHIFIVSGDVDLKSSTQLRQKLQEALKSKPSGLLIDLKACPYIDSSGIATLVEALQTLRSTNGKMAIASPSQRVKDIFEIAHLDGIFPMFPSYETAIASLK